jgi:polyketide synthase 12
MQEGKDTLREVTRVWEQVFQRAPIGPEENFFDLGGDSIAAIRIITAIHANTDVELPLISIFDHPTCAELATLFERVAMAHNRMRQQEPGLRARGDT